MRNLLYRRWGSEELPVINQVLLVADKDTRHALRAERVQDFIVNRLDHVKAGLGVKRARTTEEKQETQDHQCGGHCQWHVP